MALQPDAMGDLVTTTLRKYGRNRWTDLSTSLREFSAYPAMVKQGKKMLESDGIGYQFFLQKAGTSTYTRTGLFQNDGALNAQDVMTSGFVPWRGSMNYYIFDLQEPVLNSGESRLVDEILARRHKCWMDIATGFEIDFWTPLTSSTDTEKPYPVPCYIVQSATDSTEALGVTGGNPSGFTSGIAGIDSTSVTQWGNWSKKYKDITFPDCVTKLREAYVMCDFKSPVPQPPGYNTGDDWGIYCPYDNIAQMEGLLRTQNDNLGYDIASTDGKTTFRGVEMHRVSLLATEATLASTKPFYGINWGNYHPKFLEGWFMKDSGVKPAPDAHNVVRAFIDNRFAYVCENRRNQFVVYYSAS